MRILLINVLNEARKKPDEIMQPAFGTMYLASYLRRYGEHKDIRIIQTGHLTNPYDEYDEQSYQVFGRRNMPDLIGISSITQQYSIAMRLAKSIKETLPHVPIVIGGVHISTLPQSMTKDMDIAVIGEGEQTFLELANTYETHGQFNPYQLSNVKGIAYWDHGTLRQTERRPLIDPLDMIPHPARDLVTYQPGQVHAVLSSRGCPYKCAFCSPYAMWNSMRYNSAEYVLEELNEVISTYHPTFMAFADDLFTVNKPRLKKIRDLIIKQPWHGSVRFMCSARANLVDDDTAQLIKDIGVTAACMGLESGNQRILEYLKCFQATTQMNTSAINTLRRHGIEPIASFIIGSPNETREEILNTLEYIKKSRLEGFEVYVLVPLPGTKIWEYAKSKGIVSDSMDWSKFEFCMEEDPAGRIKVSDLSAGELIGLLDQFHKEHERRMRIHLIKRGIRNPQKIFGYLRRRSIQKQRQEEMNKEAQVVKQ